MSHDAHNPASQPHGYPRERLDAYLDGQLTGDELHAFEKSLAQDPVLQAQVDTQRSIDDSLTRLFGRAEPVSLPAQPNGAFEAHRQSVARTIEPPRLRVAPHTGAAKAKTPPAKRNLRLPALLAVAAMLALTAAGLYMTGWIKPSDFFGTRETFIGPEVVYQRKVKTGFNPDWVCETDDQFTDTIRSRWGESLLIRNTDSVKVVGWSYYEPVLSSDTLILLTKVDDTEVIVVMDHKKHDRTVSMKGCGGKLQQFREEFGNVVMYEITPLAEPRVLPLVERK